MFAMVLTGVVMVAGIAVDFARALSTKSSLQAAVDAAALAAASRKHRQSEDANAGRKQIASSALSANSNTLGYASDIQTSVSLEGDFVNVSASAVVPTTLAALITPSLSVNARARARLGTSAPLCMMALNGTATDTFKSWGTAELQAPKCAVQSHSISSTGMVTGGSATATAAHFCSAGGHSGSAFTPEVEDKCMPLDDPFAKTLTRQKLINAGISLDSGCHYNSKVLVKHDSSFDAGGQDKVVSFCGGLEVKTGATVTLQPGVYRVFNKLRINSGGTLKLNGATIYLGDGNEMSGVSNGYLEVNGGGNVDITAPATGPLKGIAIVQPTVSNYTGGPSPAITHLIIGGGSVNIVGTIYTPQAKVTITGNGTINDVSTYFSLISDFVELEGNGTLYIKAGADAMVSGMPNLPVSGGYGGKLTY